MQLDACCGKNMLDFFKKANFASLIGNL